MKTGVNSLSEARKMLIEGKFIQCREITESNIAVDAENTDWRTLLAELNLQEGESILRVAEMQFNRGKADASRKNLMKVQKLLLDHNQVLELVNQLEQRERKLEEAKYLLKIKDYPGTRTIITSNLEQSPDDGAWIPLLQSLNISEGEDLLAAAKTEFYSEEIESVFNKLKRAKELIPESDLANNLFIEMENRLNERDRFLKLLAADQFSQCLPLVEDWLNKEANDLLWIGLKSKLDKKKGEFQLHKAIDHYARNEYELSRSSAMLAVKLIPGNIQLLELVFQLDENDQEVKKVEQLITEKEYRRCREILDDKLGADTKNPIWLILLDKVNKTEGEDCLRLAANYLKDYDFETAHSYALKIVTLFPNHQEAKGMIEKIGNRALELKSAQKLFANGDFSACREVSNSQLTLSPKDPAWMNMIADLNSIESQRILEIAVEEYNGGNFDSALGLLQKSLELDPGHAKASHLHAEIHDRTTQLQNARNLLSSGKFSESRTIMDKYSEKSPIDPKWTILKAELNKVEGGIKFSVAQSHFENSDFGSARRTLSELLANMPDHRDAQQLLIKIDNEMNISSSSKGIALPDEQIEIYIAGTDDSEKETLQKIEEQEKTSIRTLEMTPKKQAIDENNLIKTIEVGGESPLLEEANSMVNREIEITENGTNQHKTDTKDEFAAESQTHLKLEEELSQVLEETNLRRGNVESNKSLQGVSTSQSLEEQIRHLLNEIDDAVIHGNNEKLKVLIQAHEHSAALRSLIGKPGLKFSHSVRSVKQNGDKTQVVVALKHALLYMPETDIYYQYETENIDNGLIISSVEMLHDVE